MGEINNTLIFDENGKYINTSNPMNVTLASHTSVGSIYDIIDKPMVSIEQDEYSISWSLINNSDELILKNTFDDTSNISLVDINLEKSTEIEKSDFNNSIAECMDKLESNVSYDSIYDNVDMNIDIKSSSVKETIILNDCNNIPEKFSYYIKSDWINRGNGYIIQYILLMKMGKKYFLYLHHLCLILQILLSVTITLK